MAGEADKAKGRMKEAVGDVTDNKDMKKEGKVDKASGDLKGKMEDAKDWAEDKVNEAKDKLHKS